ncbi:hypothetical protein ACP4OV_005931 [Aristida adscensionis]
MATAVKAHWRRIVGPSIDSLPSLMTAVAFDDKHPSPLKGCIREQQYGNAPKAARCQQVVREDQNKDEPKGMPKMIDAIKETLISMGDGNISLSAYDTAWVALVKKKNDEGPHFPSSINWIAQNQLPDGSWGDETFFLVQDRIINTLACIIALKSWNVHHDKCRKGISFISENLWRLPEDDEDWTLAGFETIFPTLLEMAKDIGLDLACDEPTLQGIYAKRDLKLTKIPNDVIHTVPTALLLSIEGLHGLLDWKRLLKLQSPDGSFMSSVAPTAYALMQSGDRKCLEFLETIVDKFNGGAPFVYPVELYERLWVIDRLERLGISYYFTSEIDGCLDYAYRHWSQQGLSFTWDCPVKDIDDTAMGFRLLRLRGYDGISPCVFKHFEKDGEFIVYPGQSNQSVSAMHNLYRAADQAAFPGDDGVLQRAKSYSHAFLQERRATGKLSDKWIISKGLPGEVAYALDFPWKANLPRVETRLYLEQYGGSANVWIGKVLHRMHLFNNDLYLKAAKADFSNFQRLCRLEWSDLKRWCSKNNLESYGVTPESALRSYFLAAANIFEPDRATERMGWARTAVLAEAISSCFMRNTAYTDNMREFLIGKLGDRARRATDSTANGLVHALRELIRHLAFDNASDSLREAWKHWLMAWRAEEGNESFGGNTALLLVRTVEICSGRHASTEQSLILSEYSQLEKLTFSICSKLSTTVQIGQNMENNVNIDQQVDLEMQELAHCVLQSCNSVNRVTRKTFLHVAKSYYYVAHCSPETIRGHISKVIFEDVI